ncbi:hypothetical protein ACT3UJ_06665 [Halomonas sp. 86]|uniref:hypothetical protein n=1 Tax=Halomonas sp. 111 TaxID=3457735 RepID=UPI004034314A
MADTTKLVVLGGVVGLAVSSGGLTTMASFGISPLQPRWPGDARATYHRGIS